MRFPFAAYDSVTFAPKAGLAPAWVCHYDAQTKAVLAGPAITELGGGEYVSVVSLVGTGVVDFGAAAAPRFQPVSYERDDWATFAALAAAGPVAGLEGALAWSTFWNLETGMAAAGPAFEAVGGGVYRFAPTSYRAAGIIDMTAACTPRYLGWSSEDVADPTVTCAPPAGTAIPRDQVLSMTVLDESLEAVVMLCVYAGIGRSEALYDGAAYLAPYFGTVTAVAGGLRFDFSRSGGFPEAPRVRVRAVDARGHWV